MPDPVGLDASLGFETPLDRVAEIARAAEAAGVAGLWTAETSHDPFLPLALAAEHTERLELGTAIAVAFARSPLVTASTAWDLARLARGRFLLGVADKRRRFPNRSARPIAAQCPSRRHRPT